MDLIANIHRVRRDLTDNGFAWIPQGDWSVAPLLVPEWRRLCEDWERLDLDRYLEKGATFRRRRYGRFHWSPRNHQLVPLANEPYFQPAEENVYAGGIVREFAPLSADTVGSSFVQALVCSTFACLPLNGERRGGSWEVRIHQIRIVASPEEPGLPAPEGIHQDGTDYLTLHLVRRHNIVGGESTIYDLERKPIQRYTLRKALDSLILEDPRVMHDVTPVFPADGCTLGSRDVLGVDYLYRPQLQRPAQLR
jgi:hypothetical protein